ncbi:MarC family protein [Lysobacter sp. SG-8]|uniref:UPF0056 membrane protein n=1 Tax=Marilutibacter penaei TaxID=2759900 RepID=A0A7W3YD98_9GAMM|nr:MarC family protein [Lysobacter penaei]MBB1087030.1 MarC family protein [Lysobacter penaei]
MQTVPLAVVLIAAAPGLPLAGTGYRFGYDELFLLFFIMLGPFKAMGAYFAATRTLDAPAVRRLGLKMFGLSVIAILLAGSIGAAILAKWQIDVAVMQLVAGLVFFLVAIQLVLVQYRAPAAPSPEQATSSPLMHLVFPVTVTPYGIAAVIAAMALSQDASRSASVLGLAVAVMVLDLLAFLGVRFIMKWIGPVPLKIVSAVLGILQVALATQLIIDAVGQMLRAMP